MFVCAVMAIALGACAASQRAVPPNHRLSIGVVPALSLAGRAGADCAVPRDWKRWTYGFESALPLRLEFEAARIARANAFGGVGHPIVFYFDCEPFVMELVALFEKNGAEPFPRAHHPEEFLAVLLAGKPAPGALWSLAAALRISPDEPFVYGKEMSLSERQSISVRFDPTNSDARLMLEYRRGL